MDNAKIYGKQSHYNYSFLFTIYTCLIAMTLLFSPGVIFVSAADTIIVDDDGTADYATIQEAINNAGIGDTIVVKDGTYAEQISIPLSISLVAASGETPVIYVSSYSYGVDISAPDVSIDGFEFYGNTSGSEVGTFPVIRGSSGSSGLSISNNVFKSFTGTKGNLAIMIQGVVTDVQIDNNQIDNYEKGVLLGGECWVKLTLNTFNDVNSNVYNGATNLNGIRDKYFGSLQDAIDDADNGDNIKVTPGFFTENLIINKPIVLLGEHEGTAGFTRNKENESVIDGVTQSAITIQPGTSSVEINGFSITLSNKDGSSNQAGILISKNTSHITLKNNIIYNITDGPGGDTINDETYGIMAYGKDIGLGQNDIEIRYNYITNVEEYGIAINDNSSNVIIADNYISEIYGSDHSGDPYWNSTWPMYICSAIHIGGQVGPISSISIANNELRTNATGDGLTTAAGSGVSFGGVDDWLDPSRTWKGFNQIFIEGCEIHNNSIGVILLTGNFTDSLDIHDCSLEGNTQYAVDASYFNDIPVNATNNWWGDISGPYHGIDNMNGTGENVTNNVIFWPWYEFDSYSVPPYVEFEVGFPRVGNGDYVSDETPFTITATDEESGIKQLEYRIWNSTTRWSNWMEYNWTFTLENEGKHKIQYNATDNAGTKTLGTSTHYVDTRGPWIDLTYPMGGEYIQDELTVTWDAADQFVDQNQEQYTREVSLTGDYPGHIQSFKPTNDELDSIELLLSGDDAEITVVLFSEIDPVPIPVAQKTKTVTGVGAIPDWVVFDFSSSVSINAGETYYIGVTQIILEGTGYKWYYFNGSATNNSYIYGDAWLKKTDSLEYKPDWDFSFRTNYWDTDNVYVDVQYTNSIPEIWSTLAEEVENTGSYSIDTSGLPDSKAYKIRLLAKDAMGNLNSDESEGPFTVDHDGIAVTNVGIVDTTISSNQYTKNDNRLEISADLFGEIEEVYADLSGFGKGTLVEPNSFFEGTATWVLNNISCAPLNGEVVVEITAYDPTGDFDSDTASIIADNKEPEVSIIKPLPGIYILDSQRILPYPYPFIFGQITMRAEAEDTGSGIDHVDIYIDDFIRESVSDGPYEFVWDEAAIGYYTIQIIAYDKVGNSKTDTVRDVFIMNFDVWE